MLCQALRKILVETLDVLKSWRFRTFLHNKEGYNNFRREILQMLKTVSFGVLKRCVFLCTDWR